MKKIISLVAAIAMAATMATSFVTVSAATLDIGVDATVTPMSATEFNDFMGESLPDGEAAYVATFSLKDFGDLNCTVSARKHSGRKISVASIEMPTLGDIANKTYTMTMSNAFTNALTEGFDEAKFTTAFASGAASTSYPTTATSGITTIENAFEMLIVVPESTSTTINYVFKGMATTYAADKAGDADDLFANGTITIGTPVQEAKLDKVVISGAEATDLTVGDQVTLTAKAYNDDETENTAAAIAWSVEGDAVSVDNGVVKAVKEGTATVTATAKDGDIEKTASVTFTVAEVPVVAVLDRVEITGATSTDLTVGDQVTLTAKAYNDDNTENTAAIAWSVEGDAVSVADGVVKAEKVGTAKVTATAKDGDIEKTASVEFTVAAAPIPELEITINGATGDVAGIDVKDGEELLGYIWKVLLKNYKAGTYTATFKAGEAAKTATISGMPDVEGNPNVSFAVILNTVKDNVTLGVTHAE